MYFRGTINQLNITITCPHCNYYFKYYVALCIVFKHAYSKIQEIFAYFSAVALHIRAMHGQLSTLIKHNLK